MLTVASPAQQDSFSAMKVFHVLQKVAKAGASVVFSIHQPSSELFNGIDHLILMNKGRVVYQGDVAEIPTFFENCGQAIPPRYNPADWILSVCHSTPVEEMVKQGFYPIDVRDPTELPQKATSIRSSRQKMSTSDDGPVGKMVEIHLLSLREFKHLYRNYIALGARMLFTMVGSLLVGGIMYGIGGEDRDEISVSAIEGRI